MTLLTADEFRAYVETELSDAALLGMLSAAEAEIDMAAGPVGSTVALFSGGGTLLVLGRAASAFTSVIETWGSTVTTLAADDYLVHPGGYVLERLNTGTNPRSRWWGRITVTYTPVDDANLRKDVQRELVSLAINVPAGLSLKTIGSWTEQYRQAAEGNEKERDAILARLSPGPSLAIVGN